MDDGKNMTLNSTCETSRDCDDDSVFSKCCVSIELTRNSTNEHDQFNRCMADQIIQQSEEWGLDWSELTESFGEDRVEISVMCLDSVAGSASINNLKFITSFIIITALVWI